MDGPGRNPLGQPTKMRGGSTLPKHSRLHTAAHHVALKGDGRYRARPLALRETA